MYNLIAYRPNGSDSCRGCHMGSSDSELIIKSCECVGEVIEEIFQCKKLEYAVRNDRSYCSFEYTIFMDGEELLYYDVEIVVNAADALMEKYAGSEKERQDQLAKDQLLTQQERQRNLEIAQLLELKNKYPEI